MRKRTRSRFCSTAAVIGVALLSGVSACGPSSPPPVVANIVVDFPGTSAADPVLLLYSGKEGTTCERFQPSVASPTVTLNAVTYDPACAVEMDAFAPGRGAYANSIDPGDPSSDDWFVTAIESGSLSISLPPLTPVPVRIWLVAAGTVDIAASETKRDVQLNKAYPIFEAMGTGLTLDTLSSVLTDTANVPKRCAFADAIAMNPAIYDASRINVYFLRDYAGILDLTTGWNCWLEGHPEIAFVSWGNTNLPLPTLTHELSHGLGLIHPKAVGGHTNYTPGFDAFNLMATNIDVADISVGQLYALNFSMDSWLNRTGSPFIRPVVRQCQDIWGAGLCPALTLFKPGWPP